MIAGSVKVLEVTAIVVAGTMTGNEIAVAAFFHPQISRLADKDHATAAQSMARALGAAMPFWYALTFLLSVAVTIFAHRDWHLPRWLALGSAILFASTILYSMLLAVPINNRVARWQPEAPPDDWRELRNRWDALHRFRVIVLVVALTLLVASCLVG